MVELTWILTCITPMGLLERCHSYKDKIAKGISPIMGFSRIRFSWPRTYFSIIESRAGRKDQKQHIEVTRDIAIKFNNMYGDTFVIPKVK